MNSFDSDIISFLNQFAHRSWAFDSFVRIIGLNNLIKGAVIPALFWWAWFRPGDDKNRDRQFLVCGIFACFLAIFAARTIADILPFRERPLLNPAVHFQEPYGADPESLIRWSSFPSDHAAVFFALGICILFASRTAGILALLHAFFVVSLPRIYLGVHYPTDVMAGLLIGISIGSLARVAAIRTAVAGPAMRWHQKDPASFHASLFVVTYLITVTFDPLRKMGVAFFSLLWNALGHLH